MILLGYLLAGAYGVFCLFVSYLLYRWGVKKEYTRKFVHIAVGFEWVILYRFFGAGLHTLAVCLLFTALLVFTYFGKRIPQIASDGDNDPGTVYYGVAMSVMALACVFCDGLMIPFGVGVFCTSVGDGLGGVVGSLVNKHNPRIFGHKTLFGALTVFAASALSTYAVFRLYDVPLNILGALAVGFFAAGLELLCGRGLDNLAVTLGSAALCAAMLYFPDFSFYAAPILLTPVLVIFAVGKCALTPLGVAAALAVDLCIGLGLGNGGFLLLCAFFVGGVLTDRVKRDYKKKILSDIEEKGSRRDGVQVLANAAVGAVAALLWLFCGRGVLVVAFVAVMAEALGDTVASGIGVLSPHTYDLFRLRPGVPGMSGGMSLLGSASALLGCVLMCLLGMLVFGLSFVSAAIAFAGALVGVLFDSFAGSVLQAKYRCTACGKKTERRTHCGEPTVLCGGVRFVTNDAVNFLSNGVSALCVCVLSLII